jgi:F0F1-type ATP synthase assembly protein I
VPPVHPRCLRDRRRARILDNMARTKNPNKEPGRIKQMWSVFQMTRRYDKLAIWYLALGFVMPIVIAVGLGVLLSGDSVIGLILYIIAGVLAGVLAFLIILGRRAERAAYSQIAGQPGAVGAVLKSSLRRGWQASEMPITVSPRTQDAVYRAVGRGGVALIGEGPRTRTQRMLEDERRNIVRILPNVPVTFLYVGPDPESVPLHKLAGSLRKLKPVLRKPEILAVSNRLSSLSKGKGGMPIPKGIDPFKARAPRPR